jgi:hypothetical protein
MSEISIRSVTVGKPIPVTEGEIGFPGDTWAPAWAKDGTIFTSANDNEGIRGAGSSNMNFNRIVGNTLDGLRGETINTMASYGKIMEKGPDDCTWKSSGCMALDGVLYWFIARHRYGQDSGDVYMRQPAHNGSIIKSTDNGKTWTRSAQENYDHPMFPGSRFATAYFLNYGRDGSESVADGGDRYVYATSNNGFWDNGDDMILGRILRSAMPRLSAADWQFFTGGDGSNDANWSSNPDDSSPLLKDPDRLGATGAVYLPKQKCYLMIGWFYPAGGGKFPGACENTAWTFYVGERPWGPWRSVGTHQFSPQGFYCPAVCPKFTSADGSTVFVFTAGDWNRPAFYRLTAVPVTLT